MNQPIDLNPIKARAIAATTDIGTALERAKAAAEFRHHAPADVLRLVEEVERLRQYTDPKLFAAASDVLDVAGKGSDEEVDLALVMLEEAVRWWDSLPWKPGDAGIELPKYES